MQTMISEQDNKRELPGPLLSELLNPVSKIYLETRGASLWALARYERCSQRFIERPQDKDRRAALDQAATEYSAYYEAYMDAINSALDEKIDLIPFDFRGGYLDAYYSLAGGELVWRGFALFARDNVTTLLVHSESIENDFALVTILTMGNATWSTAIVPLVEKTGGLLKWRDSELGNMIVYATE